MGPKGPASEASRALAERSGASLYDSQPVSMVKGVVALTRALFFTTFGEGASREKNSGRFFLDVCAQTSEEEIVKKHGGPLFLFLRFYFFPDGMGGYTPQAQKACCCWWGLYPQAQKAAAITLQAWFPYIFQLLYLLEKARN